VLHAHFTQKLRALAAATVQTGVVSFPRIPFAFYFRKKIRMVEGGSRANDRAKRLMPSPNAPAEQAEPAPPAAAGAAAPSTSEEQSRHDRLTAKVAPGRDPTRQVHCPMVRSHYRVILPLVYLVPDSLRESVPSYVSESTMQPNPTLPTSAPVAPLGCMP
jgi:hypothetical protein